MPNRPWKQEELDLLLSKKKVPTRSKKSIQRKLIILGLKKPKFKVKPHKKRAWTNEEIKLLKENKKVPNRSKEAARSMQVRLGLVQKKPYKKPWKKKDESILKKLIQEGKTPKQIFNMNVLSKKYSRNSIQKKMGYMGLSKKSVQEKLSRENLIKLKIFLKTNWQGKTPQELLELWNKDNVPKLKKNKILYHLCKLGIKIPYAEVTKIKNLKLKEEKIKSIGFKSARIFEENLRLERAKLMQERIESGRDIWTGLPCEISED